MQLLQFAAPVILVPLADPIMGFIDTLCLGQMATALELAALAPCSLILNFSNYIFNSLSIATAVLVAERLKAGDPESAGRAVSAALACALGGGLAVAATVLRFGPSLLLATGADPALLGPALTYLRIRAVSIPAGTLSLVVGCSWVHDAPISQLCRAPSF